VVILLCKAQLLRNFVVSFFYLFVVCSILIISACGGGSGGGGTSDESSEAIELSSVNFKSPKSVFIVNCIENTLSKSTPENGSLRLFQTTKTGAIEPVEIIDGKGNSHDIDIKEIAKVHSEYIVLKFDVNNQSYQILVNIRTGNQHDIKGFSSKNAFVREGYFYAIFKGGTGAEQPYKIDTLYRLNLSSMNATPINNPELNTVETFLHVYNGAVYGTKGLIDYVVRNRDSAALFFHDGSTPVIGLNAFPAEKEIITLDPDALYGTPAYMYDIKGDLYSFSREVNDLGGDRKSYSVILSKYLVTPEGVQPQKNILYTSPEVTLDPDVKGYFSAPVHVRQPRLQCMILYWYFYRGYCKIAAKPEGGFDVAYHEKDLSMIPEALDPDTNGEVIFWSEDRTFYKVNVVTDDKAVKLISLPDYADWWVVDNVIYYTQSTTDANIATYRYEIGREPVLVDNSKMELVDVIEFYTPSVAE